MNDRNAGLLDAVVLVVGAFNDLGIEYLIGGSIASSVFGEPRTTVDADLLARILGRHAEPLFRRLQDKFYVDLQAIHNAIQNQSCFNVIHLDTMSKVDIFVRWRDPFGHSQFERRQLKPIGDSKSPEFLFASAEDTVLAKLEWYRKGGEISDRQWRDLLGVLKVGNERIDRVYLRNWAIELGLTPLLERAFRDAGFEP
jgi:hypothetical protein